MNPRHRWQGLTTAAACAAGLALIASGCGGGGKKTSTAAAGGGNTSSSSTGGKTFPVFRIAQDSGVDYLDPGLSYTVEGWGVMWNVYLPLLGYKHVSGPDGATIVPYLAQDLPKVSSDGKTYTLTLRKGLKYSNGQPVKASDFKATVERDFQVDSPGVGFFGGIVGAAQYGKTKKGSIGHERQDRSDHDPPDRRSGRLPEHPRDRVRGARAREHAREGSVDTSGTVDRPVRDPELQAEQADRRGA